MHWQPRQQALSSAGLHSEALALEDKQQEVQAALRAQSTAMQAPWARMLLCMQSMLPVVISSVLSSPEGHCKGTEDACSTQAAFPGTAVQSCHVSIPFFTFDTRSRFSRLAFPPPNPLPPLPDSLPLPPLLLPRSLTAFLPPTLFPRPLDSLPANV